MHPTPLAKEPGGTSRVVGWFRRILRNVKERTLIAGSGVRMDYTEDGTVVSIAQLRRAAAGEGGGINFQGDWNADATYAEDAYTFLPQGYTDANNGTTSDHYRDSFKYTGLWRSKASNTNTMPGTDDTKWERVAEGPRKDWKVVDPDATDLNEFLQLRHNGVYMNQGPTTGVAAQITIDYSTGDWTMAFQPGGNATFNVSSQLLEGGDMTARELFLIEEGVLKRSLSLMTDPQPYSL